LFWIFSSSLILSKKPSGVDLIPYLGWSQDLRSFPVSRFMVTVPRFTKSYKNVVIVTHIWQKLSNVGCKVTLIVRNFWQLFSQIFGETLLIVTNIWQNHIFPVL
jgi:hypothetical protein